MELNEILLKQIWVFVVVCVLFMHPLKAQDIEFGSVTVRLIEFATGFDITDPPTDLDLLGDGSGRYVVSTFAGSVRLLDREGNFLDTDAIRYIDETSTTIINGEYGATAIAVHPDFLNNGRIYGIVTESDSKRPVDFGTSNSDHDDVLVEWRIQDNGSPGLADDIASNMPEFIRRDLLRIGQPSAIHNMVDLAFDNSGLLHVSAGDGGPSANAQDRSTVFGNILRVDPLANNSDNGQYGIPNDNPFVGNKDGFMEEVYAYGLRSPYRISFDNNGDLYIGDVGSGGSSGREEINLLPASDGFGVNFGWNQAEGIVGDPTDGFRDPIFEYAREDGQTIIGGVVYRGALVPDLNGNYLFAEFGRQVTAGQAQTSTRLFSGNVTTGEIFEIKIDPNGELLVNSNGETVANIFSIAEGIDEELFLLVGDDPFPTGPAAGIPEGRILKMTALLGDLNCDGVIDLLDIAPFVKAIGNADFDAKADLNGDGFDNLLDIVPFTSLLTGS